VTENRPVINGTRRAGLIVPALPGREQLVLHAGLAMSRKRIDVCLVSDRGELIGHLRVPADRDGLYGLMRLAVYGERCAGWWSR
jgi:hypothetical protein